MISPDDEAARLPQYEDPSAAGAPPVGVDPNAQIVPPPEYGPPAPDPTDAILANTPQAPAGLPTRDPAAEWPPGVPSQAPGVVATAPSLNPQGPAGPQGDAAPAAPAEGVAGALQASHDARSEADAARVDALGGQEEVNHAAAEEASKRARLAEERVKQEQAIQAQYNDADKAAQAQVAQTQAALKDFKFRDLWNSKTTVQRVGSELSTALLAIGAGMMKTPKYAIEILDKEMDDDHKRQVEHLGQLKDADLMARTGLADSRAARTRAMADLTLGDAQKDRVIAAQFEETAARAKDENSANEARAFAAKLKQEAAEKDVQAQTILRTFAIQDAAGKAKADEAEALARLHNAQAAAGGYNPNTGRHKGAGGGGHGGGGSKALTDFVTAAGALKPGDPITPEIAVLGRQAGLKPNQIAAEVDRYRGSGAKSEKGAAAGDNAVNAFVRTRLKDDKELAGDLKERQEVNKALGLAKPGPDGNVSGVNFQQAIDATVKAATGLGARPGSIAVFQGSLGGVWDKVMRAIQHGETGQYTAHDVQVLNDALKKQRDYVTGNLKEKEATYREEFGKHPTTKDHREAYEAELGSKFGSGGATGQGGQAAKARAWLADPANAKSPLRDGVQKKLDSMGDITL